MRKFKRYLGIIFSIALLAVAFFPMGPHYYWPMASKVTPLDTTALSTLSMKPEEGDAFHLWLYATNHFNSCPPFQKNEVGQGQYFGFDCSRDADYIFRGLAGELYKQELSKFESSLSEIVDEYRTSQNEDREYSISRRLSTGLPKSRSQGPKELSKEHKLQIGSAIAKYLESERLALSFRIYLIHLIVVVAAFLCIVFRQNVGAIIMWPFTIIYGALFKAVKIAKDVHEKI